MTRYERTGEWRRPEVGEWYENNYGRDGPTEWTQEYEDANQNCVPQTQPQWILRVVSHGDGDTEPRRCISCQRIRTDFEEKATCPICRARARGRYKAKSAVAREEGRDG